MNDWFDGKISDAEYIRIADMHESVDQVLRLREYIKTNGIGPRMRATDDN